MAIDPLVQEQLDRVRQQLANASTLATEAALMATNARDLAVHATDEANQGKLELDTLQTMLDEDTEPPPPDTDHFRVVDGVIRDPSGQIFRPDGSNVTGADSYQWGQEWNAHGKATLWKQRGARAVRLVYCTQCASHGPGSQHYGELADLVAEYTAQQVVVIIDNHEFDLGGTPPTEAQVQATAARFSQFAEQFGDNPYVWYECFNEPMDEGQTLDLQSWLAIHRPVCEAIRQHTEAPIVVCASMFGQDRAGFGGFDVSDSSLLNGVPTLMQEFRTVIGDLHGYHRWGGATTAADHQAYWRAARDRGVAILVGEFGAWGLHGQFDDEERQATNLLYSESPHYVGLLPWMTGTWGDEMWQLQANRMANVPVEDNLGEGPGPEPPTQRPPLGMTAHPGDEQVQLGFTHPAEIPAEFSVMFVAWGNAQEGHIGTQTFQRPFPASLTILSLANGVEHTFQGAYARPGEMVPQAELTTVRATPQDSGPPPNPVNYPRGGTITERRNWILGKAGLADPGALRVVGPNNVPSGCQWVVSGGWNMLYVWDATLLENLDMPGRIVPRGASGPDITIRNCRFGDIFTWEAHRVRTVSDCHAVGNPQQVASSHWGQANLNALRGNWTVERTILEGMADNIQVTNGGGLLVDSVLRNLVIFGPAGSGSHNDHIQNYGGLVNMRRVLVEQQVTASQDSHVNSIFCDGGDYDMEDCLVLINAPAGSNTWALHAAKGNNRIVVRHTSVRGKVIGNVVRQEGADISSPY